MEDPYAVVQEVFGPREMVLQFGDTEICTFIVYGDLGPVDVDWLRYTENTETGEKVLEMKPIGGKPMKFEVV